jgi:hypothetical protein
MLSPAVDSRGAGASERPSMLVTSGASGVNRISTTPDIGLSPFLEDVERLRQLAPRQAPREHHADITSSCTKWRRMTFGACPSSK